MHIHFERCQCVAALTRFNIIRGTISTFSTTQTVQSPQSLTYIKAKQMKNLYSSSLFTSLIGVTTFVLQCNPCVAQVREIYFDSAGNIQVPDGNVNYKPPTSYSGVSFNRKNGEMCPRSIVSAILVCNLKFFAYLIPLSSCFKYR